MISFARVESNLPGNQPSFLRPGRNTNCTLEEKTRVPSQHCWKQSQGKAFYVGAVERTEERLPKYRCYPPCSSVPSGTNLICTYGSSLNLRIWAFLMPSPLWMPPFAMQSNSHGIFQLLFSPFFLKKSSECKGGGIFRNISEIKGILLRIICNRPS